MKHPFAEFIIERLRKAGHTAYYAGGWVRDLLLGRESDDIDIATSASPDQITALFPKTVSVGAAFGVIVVLIEQHSFEVSTFRTDLEYIDGRKPTGIKPSNPQEDAQRRDFTINGMFYDPIEKTIIDYVGGQKDLEKGIIRAIGNAEERFQEDRLRMIRAVRFAAALNYQIEQSTLSAIKLHAPQLLPAVSMERIWQEIKKMAHPATFGKALELLHELKLLKVIFPSLSNLNAEDIQRIAPAYLYFPKNAPAIAFLLALFPLLQENELKEISAYLKTSRNELKFGLDLLKGRDLVNAELKGHAPQLVEWSHYYALLDAKCCLEILAACFAKENHPLFLQEHEQRYKTLKPYVKRIKNQTPLITAEMLKSEGIQPGKTMGLLLKKAEEIAIQIQSEDPLIVMQHLKTFFPA